jgi:hypothetical protein
VNHGGKTFAQFYGVGRNHTNAFGKCVSAKERAASAAEVSAASACRTESGAAAFATCVALKVSPLQPSELQQQAPTGTTPGCGPGTDGPAHPLSCTVAKTN